MLFHEWLDAERGRLTKVADHFNVSLSAVSQWRANGVPVDKILDVHNLTGGEVSVTELVDRPKPAQAVAHG